MTALDLLLLLFAPAPLSIPAFQPTLAVLEARIVAAGDGLLGCELYPFAKGTFSSDAEIGLSELLRDGLVESVKGGRIRLGLTTLGRARVATLTKGEEGRAVARLVRLGKREGAEVLREQWGRLDQVNLEAREGQRKTPLPGEAGRGLNCRTQCHFSRFARVTSAAGHHLPSTLTSATSSQRIPLQDIRRRASSTWPTVPSGRRT